MNFPLLSLIFTIASGTTIGVLMTIALVLGFDEIPQIIMVCIAGLILSVPIAWIVAKRMQSIGMIRPK